MKYKVYTSMSLCLLIAHCSVPAADQRPASSSSSLSLAPAKSAAAGGVITNVPDKKSLRAADLIALGQWKGEIFALAAENDDTDMVRSLIDDHGFDDLDDTRIQISRRVAISSSASLPKALNPLHFAVIYDAENTIKLLVDRKADVNIPLDVDEGFYRGRGPFGFAFVLERHKALKALLKVGAKKRVENGHERRVSTQIEIDNNYWLAYYSGIQPTAFRTLHDENAVDQKAMHEIDFNAMLGAGDGVALTRLIMLKQYSEIQKLADANKISQDQIMRRDNLGRNPWLWAASIGNLDVMKILMARGNALPLHIPTWKERLKKTFKIVSAQSPERLVFDPYCEDENGNDALAIAQARGYPHVVNFFYHHHAPARAEIIAAWQTNYRAMPAAVAHITGEYCYGSRAVPVPQAIEAPELPRAVGGAVAKGRLEKSNQK